MKPFILSLIVLTSCSSIGGSHDGGDASAPMPDYRKPSDGAKRYMAKNGWDIRDEGDLPKIGKVSKSGGVIVWDLQGAILDGKNQKGNGDQDESQEPLFRAHTSLVVKNGFVQNNKNSMAFFKGKSGIEKLTFTNIGEDAIVVQPGAEGLTIKNCEFLNTRDTGDKSIQLNSAKGVVVEGTTIYRGITCIAGKGAKGDTLTLKNNKFVGCDTGMNATRITVKMVGNTFEKVRLEFKGQDGAVRE